MRTTPDTTATVISRWARRRADRPRYYVTAGRKPLGVIFEARGVYAAVDPNGNLVTASTSVLDAANALAAGASSL
jgi:hypothetical protein